MFQRILVPLDLTDRHQAAISAAAALAKQGSEIVLLHVIETIPGLGDKELKGFYARIEQTATEHLERIGKDLTAQHVKWHSKVTVGFPVQEIVEYAAQEKAELIVLTAPRIDTAQPGAGFASLSWKVALLAPCPVLLVK